MSLKRCFVEQPNQLCYLLALVKRENNPLFFNVRTYEYVPHRSHHQDVVWIVRSSRYALHDDTKVLPLQDNGGSGQVVVIDTANESCHHGYTITVSKLVERFFASDKFRRGE